jgi:hypothetical protein
MGAAPALDDRATAWTGQFAVLAERLPRLPKQVRLTAIVARRELHAAGIAQTMLTRDGVTQRELVQTRSASGGALVANRHAYVASIVVSARLGDAGILSPESGKTGTRPPARSNGTSGLTRDGARLTIVRAHEVRWEPARPDDSHVGRQRSPGRPSPPPIPPTPRWPLSSPNTPKTCRRKATRLTSPASKVYAGGHFQVARLLETAWIGHSTLCEADRFRPTSVSTLKANRRLLPGRRAP